MSLKLVPFESLGAVSFLFTFYSNSPFGQDCQQVELIK